MKRMLWRIVLLLLTLSFFHSIYAQNEELIFSATGDVPYGSSEIPILMQEMADHNLYSPSEFLVHVGDIKSGSSACEESIYSEVADILKTASVPVYIVPGDNEYNDCSNPAQAWQWWTQYFMNFEDNFCGTPPTEHQSAQPENHAFVIKGVLMIGINLVGGRIQSQNEWNTRMQNDADWVDHQFQTKGSQVRAAVVYCQAGPNNSNRDLFFNQFRQSAVTFGKPILLLHGDGHSWKYDQPFPEQNIYRIQVNMGGLEDPVQLTVNLDPVNPFAYLRDPWSNNPQPYNVMPCVEAGPDTTIYLPDMANLHARSRDDGVPSGTITRTWSKVSGPGTVSFGDLHADTTSASFSAPGIYTLRMTADDGVLQNSDDLIVTAISQGPLLTIDNVTLTEGNSGTSHATFTVSLVNSNGSTVTVDFSSADSNATAGEDYAAASGALTFSGSTTSRTINVAVNGDAQIEPDETFFVNLSNATNATILDFQGRGIIENDDFPPPPVISSFMPQEGPVGTEVTITGNYLLTTTAVRFNSATATNLIIDNDNTIRATVPPGAGSGKIRVTNGHDSTLSATDFVVKATLAVTVSGNGSVSLDPAGGVYDEGTVVTLTANPDPGWNFVGWSGDLGGAVNPADVTMDSNKDVTASFAQQGVGPVVHEETQSGGSSGSSTVSTGAPLTGLPGICIWRPSLPAMLCQSVLFPGWD